MGKIFLSCVNLQKLYSDNREEKKGLLKGLTLGREDTPNISPLQQVLLDDQ